MPEQTGLDPRRVPPAVCDVVRALSAAGHRTVLVGGCVRDLLRGAEVRDFDAATQASADELLRRFRHGVPIGSGHGTVMVPTAAGPVDVTPLRAGPGVENDLAHRDFTVNAIAFDPLDGRLIDPFDGRGDLARRRLRAVGSARERFREDPLRVLRAARLVATLGLEPDPELLPAMRECAPALSGVARERVRAELTALVLGARAGAGLALLQQSGAAEQLAPGLAGNAWALVDALPLQLELRLAAWLRGTRAVSILRRLRFPNRCVEQVEQLLRHHPVEACADLQRDASIRRLLQRVGVDFESLVALRRAELALGGGDASRLDALEAGVARVRRAGNLALQRRDLALKGDAVLRRLGCPRGPHVGDALGYLTDRVVEDPSCNTPERLAALLDAWWQERRG